jgi:hypothetical protein
MSVYHYEHNNKFPHLILVEVENISFYKNKMNHEQNKQWLKQHIGKFNVDWSVNSATMLNGRKYFYDKRASFYETKRLLKHARQYAFKSKDDALKFKLSMVI